MKRALDFLKNHVEIAFATSEGNRPHIRIFQIMKMEGSTQGRRITFLYDNQRYFL